MLSHKAPFEKVTLNRDEASLESLAPRFSLNHYVGGLGTVYTQCSLFTVNWPALVLPPLLSLLNGPPVSPKLKGRFQSWHHPDCIKV